VVTVVAALAILLGGIVVGFVCAGVLFLLGALLVLSGRRSREEGE
jgi:hypothetical protein